jgi:hypothetical protein
MPNLPLPHAGKRGFRGFNHPATITKLSSLLYNHLNIPTPKMILAVLEYIVGLAGILVLSVLCLHHGRYISSQVCCLV